MTSKKNTSLYTGMTNNLERRVKEHKGNLNSGFTKKYNCHKLVYFEVFHSAIDSIKREKQIKGGSRKSKNNLVDLHNPEWKDLSEDWD